MSAIAGQTAGPKLFEGTFEYPWGNIGKKNRFLNKFTVNAAALQLVT